MHKNPSLPVDADLREAESLLPDGGFGLLAVRAPNDGVDDDAPEDLALNRLHRRARRSNSEEKERGELRAQPRCPGEVCL